MKYKDPVTGEMKTLSVKAADTLPIGTIVDYDGDTVPDGWEEVSDYSEDEIDTGQKWIDGKPIYRKVISFTSISNFNIGSTIDTLVNSWLMVSQKETGSWRTVPWLFSIGSSYGTATWAGGYSITPDGLVQFQLGTELASIAKGHLVVEYTK